MTEEELKEAESVWGNLMNAMPGHTWARSRSLKLIAEVRRLQAENARLKAGSVEALFSDLEEIRRLDDLRRNPDVTREMVEKAADDEGANVTMKELENVADPEVIKQRQEKSAEFIADLMMKGVQSLRLFQSRATDEIKLNDETTGHGEDE